MDLFLRALSATLLVTVVSHILAKLYKYFLAPVRTIRRSALPLAAGRLAGGIAFNGPLYLTVFDWLLLRVDNHFDRVGLLHPWWPICLATRTCTFQIPNKSFSS
jgi:hypothetical protein